jgi:hypothetical protein
MAKRYELINSGVHGTQCLGSEKARMRRVVDRDIVSFLKAYPAARWNVEIHGILEELSNKKTVVIGQSKI